MDPWANLYWRLLTVPFLKQAQRPKNGGFGAKVQYGGYMALTKSDIVEKIYDLGFSKKEAVDIVEELIEIIKKSLEEGDDVLIFDEIKYFLAIPPGLDQPHLA